MNTSPSESLSDDLSDYGPRPAKQGLSAELLGQLRQAVPEDVRQSIPVSVSSSFPNHTQTLAGAGPMAEILPGYTIDRPLGSGGFGEVFLCNAPGGIKKAVKVVYGSLDDERAEREMRSLERIKDVRHPFLVGLERVEIVNQQLVFVTELADRSLKDRFREATQDGRSGIPRDELMSYLRDASEALDYLYEKHTLQHLDIKPENMLLVGDHLKVADFGLIKDLRDASMSMVGGVTPLYAPPEVLDGRPSRHSDQYSLAIVYMEMLTGELPFNGRTAGQLAAQHMHSAPNLSALPTSDRYAIGKALSKSPMRRFESCREFVQAILNPPKKSFAVRGSESDSVEVDPDIEQSSAANSPLMQTTDVATQALPPMDGLVDHSAPAVVIGLGGLGGAVVKGLRNRLAERFGADTDVPAVQLLYIDTERDAVSDATRGHGMRRLQPNETLLIPLRSAQEYREQKKSLLSWISRRWLYNIPRSLRTEGIRPLGRLALVDHAMTVKHRIESAIAAAANPASAQQSTVSTGVAFAAKAPRVFVVASTAGGTGSGMLTDVGYLAQQVMSDLKLDGHVVGVAMHGSGLRTETRDLAHANTIATMAELFHFSQDHERYPGDECFPPAPTGNAPFQHTYSLNLGDELSESDFAQRSDEIATYLSNNIVGASASFFDVARRDADVGEATVRSFGVGTLGGSSSASLPSPDVLCDAILDRWVEHCQTDVTYGGAANPQVTASSEIDRVASETLIELGLQSTDAPGITLELESRVDICKGVISEAWAASASSGVARRAEATLALVEGALSGDESNSGLCGELAAAVSKNATKQRDERLKVIRETIFSPPTEGVPGIEDAMGMMFALIRELVDAQQACDSRAKQRRAEVDALRRSGPPKGADRGKSCSDEFVRYLIDYCRRRLGETIEQTRASELQALIADTVGASQLFGKIRQSLDAARDVLGRVATGRDDLSEDMLDRFEQRVRNDVLSRVGTFWPMVIVDPKHRNGFIKALRQVATDAVSEHCLAVSTAASATDGSDDPVRDAKPRFTCRPGSVRWLITGPTERAVAPLMQRLERQFGQKPTFVHGGDGRVTLYCEGENLPMGNVTREMIGGRSDLLEVAHRIRSRQDIDWIC